MKFYFCEKCGQRLTEDDIEKGEARNKKLRGVFCQACSVGVLTLETLPLDEEKARVLLKKEPPKRSSGEHNQHRSNIRQARGHSRKAKDEEEE